VSLGALALRHRALILTAALVTLVMGIAAGASLGSGIYPEVDFPRIVVVARDGDASPDLFATSVTRPLEDALVTVLGVRRVRSRTVRGAVEISLLFVSGTDMDLALQLVQAQIGNARQTLPATTVVEVERLTPTAFPVVTFNLSGPIDSRDLHDLGELVVRPALARVEGVGQVRVLGGDVREVEVILDPSRLAAAHLHPADVAARIQAETTLVAVGRLDEDRRLMTIIASAEAVDLDSLRAVPLTIDANGAPVRLGAIAEVVEGHTDLVTAVSGPDGPCVVVSVSRLPGASTAAVVRAVEAVVNELGTSLPRGVTLTPVYDQADLVEESVASVRDAILAGIVLCLIVLGLSLRDVRAGLTAALTLPVVLGATLLVMRATGASLNLMSLGGMAVAIGLVIDDAIIVVEAIARRLEEGDALERAVVHGTDEVGPAVLGTTVTTIIVFLPLAFVAGIVGEFFAALAVTLTVAVVASLVAALLLVPVLGAGLMRARPARETVPRLELVYRRIAHAGATRKWLGPVLVAAAIALIALAARYVESGFLPGMDEGAFVLDYYLPAGTSLAETDRAVSDIETILRETDGVATYTRRTGSELGPAAATQPNTGDIMVRLSPLGTRPGSEDVVESIRARIVDEVPSARIEFVRVLEDVLNDLSGAPDPIEVKFFGEDPTVLAELAREAASRMEGVDGLVDLYDGLEGETSTLTLHIDRDAAGRVGRTPLDLSAELSAALGGLPAGTMRRFDRAIGIRVRYPDAVRFDPAAIAELPIGSTTLGTPVSLRTLARLERTPVPVERIHEGLSPVVIVTGATEGRDLGSVVRDVRAALATMGTPTGVRREIGGQIESQADTFRDLAYVAGAGLLLTLLVMIAQFRRVMPAIAVLLTTPFALAGALVTLLLTGTPLDASSLMGMILLVGLEVKSGILLLEVAEAHVDEGHTYVEALRLACERRIRPIMLTATATMVGVLPLALGVGAGAEIQRPLAIAVLGGIGLSKFVTLLALPSLAALLADRRVARSMHAAPSESAPIGFVQGEPRPASSGRTSTPVVRAPEEATRPEP
jgi:CzcA family heavy metal efflux pump